MYTERTTITGFFVDSDSGQLALSIPAADLYDAAKSSEVLLSWQSIDGDENVVTKYSRLVSTSRSPLDVTEDVLYTFVFDNGETYFNDGNVYAERTSGDTDVPADPQTGGGSGGGVLVVTDTDGTLDKTWQEIHDAALNGVVVLVSTEGTGILHAYLYEMVISGDEYQVAFGESYYIASSASGYPTYTAE